MFCVMGCEQSVQSKIKKAQELQKQGNYDEAISVLSESGDNKEVKEIIRQCKYGMAEKLYLECKYDDCLLVLKTIKEDEQESQKLINEYTIKIVEKLCEDSDYENAWKYLQNSNLTEKDSEEIKYKVALGCYNKNNYKLTEKISEKSNIYAPIHKLYLKSQKKQLEQYRRKKDCFGFCNYAVKHKVSLKEEIVGAYLKKNKKYFCTYIIKLNEMHSWKRLVDMYKFLHDIPKERIYSELVNIQGVYYYTGTEQYKRKTKAPEYVKIENKKIKICGKKYNYKIKLVENKYHDLESYFDVIGTKYEISLIEEGEIDLTNKNLSLGDDGHSIGWYRTNEAVIKDKERIKREKLERQQERAKRQQEYENNKPRIGMTREEVEKSSWGKPKDINKTTFAWGTTEQWCYSNYRYIYFTNGIVEAISE